MWRMRSEWGTKLLWLLRCCFWKKTKTFARSINCASCGNAHFVFHIIALQKKRKQEVISLTWNQYSDERKLGWPVRWKINPLLLGWISTCNLDWLWPLSRTQTTLSYNPDLYLQDPDLNNKPNLFCHLKRKWAAKTSFGALTTTGSIQKKYNTHALLQKNKR